MARPRSDQRGGDAGLNDPETCGEDLPYNLAQVCGLARQYCVDCADYHVIFVARRAVQPELVESDRLEIAAAVENFVRARLDKVPGPVAVVIAGCADTGVLATAAHGVARIGADSLARTGFTVLDRCGTPLALCRTYAERLGLTAVTETVDIVADEAVRSADLVIVHSLLRHVPEEAHVATLRKIAGWLAPGGSIVFSHRLEDEGDRDRRPAERAETRTRIRQAVAEGHLTLGEPIEAFEARLARRGRGGPVHRSRYASQEPLRRLFAAAGVLVASLELIETGGPGARRRVLAVLGRG